MAGDLAQFRTGRRRNTRNPILFGYHILRKHLSNRELLQLSIFTAVIVNIAWNSEAVILHSRNQLFCSLPIFQLRQENLWNYWCWLL